MGFSYGLTSNFFHLYSLWSVGLESEYYLFASYRGVRNSERESFLRPILYPLFLPTLS